MTTDTLNVKIEDRGLSESVRISSFVQDLFKLIKKPIIKYQSRYELQQTSANGCRLKCNFTFYYVVNS